MSLFRYIGNKNRLVKYYKPPPKNTKRIVEVFAGSMAYALSYNYDILGIEINPRLVDVYKYIQTGDLDNLLERFQRYQENFDIRKSGEFTNPEKDYIRLSSGSMMTGGLDKNIIYVNEKPLSPCIKKTKEELDKIKTNNMTLQIECGNCFWLYTHDEIRPGDLVFIDPPYETSSENYGLENSQTHMLTEYVKYLSKSGVPIIFTYGDYAPEVFPEFNWELVTEITVVKTSRTSRQRTRKEWVCYINFDD